MTEARILKMAMVITLAIFTGMATFSDLWIPTAHANEEYEHLRVALRRDIVNLDPLGYPSLSREELNVHKCLYDHLFGRDDDGKIVPELATGYQWQNSKTLRIKLREGVTFHNGDRFSAVDVKWSIEDMLDPARGPGLVGFLEGIEKVEIMDDFTVDIHTKEPMPTLPARLTCYTLIVNSKQRSQSEPKDYENSPIGTGPFKLVEWKKGERIVMERYDKYWKGIPKIKKLTIYPILDQNTRISALKAGTIDVATDISPALAKELLSSPVIEVTSVPSVRCDFVWLRTEQPPFNDKRVRQALNYAVNKEEYVKELMSGFGLPLGQPLPPYFFGHNPNIKPYPYDPEKAKQLLKEAGYAEGFEVFYETPALFEENARAIAGYLQAIGVKCRIEVKEFAAAYGDLLERKMRPIMHFSWGNWSLLDVDGTLQFVFGCTKPGQGKWSYYCNPRIEEIIAESKTIDEKRRLALSEEAMQILHEEAPLIFLYAQQDIHAKRLGIAEFKARTDNTINLKWVKEK